MSANTDRYRDVAAAFNEYLKDFFEPADNHTTYHFGYKPVLELIGEIKNFPDISVFDYGAGAGQFCAYLNELGVQVTGFEISEAMLERPKTIFRYWLESF
jgi:SAM-dependent methyltransferase